MYPHRGPASKARGAAFGVLVAVVLVATAFAGPSGASRAQGPGAKHFFGPPDLYIQDTPLDTGVEPNPDTGPMWVSDDIWVRTSPDPGWQPYPFPAGSPPWTPLANQSPEYRDPKYSVPNYVYVRVRNRGTSASSGTEQLHLYFAKASTGLSWPTQWVDYMSGSPLKLYGEEITKPRQNAGTATAAQRTAYKNAIIAANAINFFGGVSYWHKQQEVHAFGPVNRHGTPAFLPWHREFLNRYEVLLEESDPLVKLLYWDWTTDPENTTGGTNLFTSSFMGASGRGIGPVSIGAPFMPALSPPTVTRNLSTSVTPPASSDASILGSSTYPTVASVIENVPNHNSAHGYIGGGGDMSYIGSAAQDPFFFLLHANVDRLWAQWQRNVTQLGRLDPATTYGTYSSNVNITTSMAPWDGTGTAIQPWTIAGGYIVSKTPKDPSVVSPPVYDTAPVVVPVLQPGEAVVLQIPWYPPNPADFASFGGDQGHFCLLARVTTSNTAPFGMTFPETTDINGNTKNNNNIAWKNVTVVDNFPGPLGLASALIRNVSKVHVLTGIHFATPVDATGGGPSFFDYGQISVDLKPELYKLWVAGGAAGQGIERGPGTTIKITSPNAYISNIDLEGDAVYSIDAHFTLNQGYKLPRGVVPKWDIYQTGTPDDPNAIVGGQRYDLNFNKLVQVKAGSVWRYLDGGENPPVKWQGPDLDASKNWKQGQAPLGYGDDPVTTIDGGPVGKRFTSAYFVRAFDVDDPSFLQGLRLKLRRNDGAVVYLNGTEVYRVNMPEGPITQTTPATRDVNGLEREVYFPVPVDGGLLHTGQNTVAVEIHVASPQSRDLTFDLELYSNSTTTTSPPSIAFTTPADGQLFQTKRPIPINVEALDTDGQIGSVAFYADGLPIGADDSAPYSVQWQGASLGPHRLRAVATDNDQEQAAVERTVTVLDNTPPTVTLTQPSDGTAFRADKPILAAADASDENGAVNRVEFYLRDMDLGFSAPNKLVDRDFVAPYTARITGVAPGMYMLEAVAVDNLGARGQGLPVMIMVDGAAPVTTASFSPPAVNGWYSNPTITLSATDEGSGVDSITYSLDGGPDTTYTTPFSVSKDGVHTLRVFATDMAGNVGQDQVIRFHVDSTGPTVTITAPAEGATYHQGKAQPAKYRCADGFSGVASCKGTVPNGANIDTSIPGPHTFTVVATDRAGNTRTVSHTYQVR
jgi:hypothetical protein